MATAIIITKSPTASLLSSTGYASLTSRFNQRTTTLTDMSPSTDSLEPVNFYNSDVIFNKNLAVATEVLPFRIRITNIGIDAYGPGNPAPIGIAIIGLNNYVM
tara:strand:+ start:11335 stop:11643 length:309 start_codon:yes stop_codon:yes gene_type:complete